MEGLKIEQLPQEKQESKEEKENYETVKNELLNDLKEKLFLYARSNSKKNQRKVENFIRTERELILTFIDEETGEKEEVYLEQVDAEYKKGSEKDVAPVAVQIAQIIKERGQKPVEVTYIIDSCVIDITKKSPDEPDVKEDIHMEATIPYGELEEAVEKVAKELVGEIKEKVVEEEDYFLEDVPIFDETKNEQKEEKLPEIEF
jgi:hypothetical protein